MHRIGSAKEVGLRIKHLTEQLPQEELQWLARLNKYVYCWQRAIGGQWTVNIVSGIGVTAAMRDRENVPSHIFSIQSVLEET